MAKYVTREMDVTVADVFYFDRASMEVKVTVCNLVAS